MSQDEEEISRLRNSLLELGQPIVIPAREIIFKDAKNYNPTDITVYPCFEVFDESG